MEALPLRLRTLCPNSSFRKGDIPLLLIHPIGVGLSFWHRFCCEWYETDRSNPIYNPDLLGCGESDMPRSLYPPTDWAGSCNTFAVVQKPVILLVQGALLPVAIALVHLQTEPNWIRQLVLLVLRHGQ